MELANRDLLKAGDYGPIAGSSRASWCSKRILAASLVLILLIVVIVTLVYTWGSSGTRVPDGWSNLPTLKWEGDCPVEASECPQSFQGLPPPLLLISLDGFRADYLSRSDRIPTIRKLARCGVQARFLGPVYPSKTFPNHYTQVTGLYPSSHGIIDNAMYDPDTDKDFKLGQPTSFEPEWWQREPIWVSAEKQGKRTATYFWPGSDVRINGTRPTFYKNYSSKVPFESRVVQILEWLDLPPPLRPSFLTLYFNEPDTAEHAYGTKSKEVQSALERVDRMVEGLFAGLQARNLTGCVNVFFVSDHGMADIECGRVVDLREYINVSEVRAQVGTFGRLRPLSNKTSVSDLLASLRCRNEHLRVFLKEDLPVRMHFSKNPRIEPVIVDTDSGWTVFKFDYDGHKYCTGASHGYDNFFPEMRAFFMAIGPSMKRNVTVDPFLNIELYELMCELIDITPNPNNGTRGSLHHLLRLPNRPLPPRTSNITIPPIAEVAKDAKEYAKRVEEAHCPCPQSHPQVDIPVGSSVYHLPLGAPSSTASVFLENSDYVLGYDERKRIAQWAAFTLNNTELQDANNISDVVCWRGDARVAGVGCADYDALREEGFIQWPLYPPIFSDASTREEASYVTNSIPVTVEFATIIAEEFWKWLKNETRSQMHVITGPAFVTKQHRDVGDFPVPSHLFVIAISCSEENSASSIADCPSSRLRVDAFLLPNYPYPDNCEAAWRVIERNAARVVDIEGATGLEFFTGLPQYDALRLRTALPSVVTTRQLVV